MSGLTLVRSTPAGGIEKWRHTMRTTRGLKTLQALLTFDVPNLLGLEADLQCNAAYRPE